MFEYTPCEYRLIYHWDTVHWTCIATGDTPTDINTYINKHHAEMQEAIVTGEEYFSVIQYYYGDPVRKWRLSRRAN